jgi:hypothetical protein
LETLQSQQTQLINPRYDLLWTSHTPTKKQF